MYVCMYLYMYVCMYVSMCVCIYVCMKVCTYACMYLRMYTNMYACMYCGGAHGVMVIVAGYGHADTSSNPGPDWLYFTSH